MNLIEAMDILEAGGMVKAVGRNCVLRCNNDGPEPVLEWSLASLHGEPDSWTPWAPWPSDFRGEYKPFEPVATSVTLHEINAEVVL